LQEAVIDFSAEANDCEGMSFSAAYKVFSPATPCVKKAEEDQK